MLYLQEFFIFIELMMYFRFKFQFYNFICLLLCLCFVSIDAAQKRRKSRGGKSGQGLTKRQRVELPKQQLNLPELPDAQKDTIEEILKNHTWENLLKKLIRIGQLEKSNPTWQRILSDPMQIGAVIRKINEILCFRFNKGNIAIELDLPAAIEWIKNSWLRGGENKIFYKKRRLYWYLMDIIKTPGEEDAAVEAMKRIINCGIDINMMYGAVQYIDDRGNAPLIRAASYGREKIVTMLLDHRANINIIDNVKGYTALMGAARYGKLETVKILINRGAAVNMKSNTGDTALTWASDSAHAAVVEQLLKFSADINIKNAQQQKALDLANKAVFYAGCQGPYGGYQGPYPELQEPCKGNECEDLKCKDWQSSKQEWGARCNQVIQYFQKAEMDYQYSLLSSSIVLNGHAIEIPDDDV